MASIEKVTKRSGDRGWRARYRDPDGRSRERWFDRKVDAENFLDGIRGDLVRGAYIDPDAGRQTFVSFADVWSAAQDWKATSRESWLSVRKRLELQLGSMPLASIDLIKLQTVQRALGERYAPSTTKTTMAYAGMIMRAAHAAGRIGRDPTRGLRAPKTRVGDADGKVGPDDVPTRTEASRVRRRPTERPSLSASRAFGSARCSG
jgi:hypothetical protein